LILRDQLKHALSNGSPVEDEPSQMSVSGLAERITELKAAPTTEDAPTRTSEQAAASAEEPITARLRRRIQTEETQDPPVASVTCPEEDPAHQVFVSEPETPSDTASPLELRPVDTRPAVTPSAPQKTSFRERVNRGNRQMESQLSLF
jgi:hypothetical protein